MTVPETISRTPEALDHALRQQAKALGLPLNDLINSALDAYLRLPPIPQEDRPERHNHPTEAMVYVLARQQPRIERMAAYHALMRPKNHFTNQSSPADLRGRDC